MRDPAVSRYAAGALSPRRRADDLRRLAEERFDVLVIGGGVTGAGAALDAASRGLSVALVEAVDLAAGTSSRSTLFLLGSPTNCRSPTLEQGNLRFGAPVVGSPQDVNPNGGGS